MADKPELEQEEESLDTSSQAKVILKDPFVGNVSKLAPLPVDHKGPPMRGHLIFDSCFEGGGVNNNYWSLLRQHSAILINRSMCYVQGI